MSNKVAIIGAGMAGLAAARRLSAAGMAVSLFDKGRGIGGRAATRRSEGWQFDHGLRCIEAADPQFAALVAEWRAAGAVADWHGLTIGVPSMNAPLRSMLGALTLRNSCQVAALADWDGGWRLLDSEAVDLAAERFDTVILAVPAPQVGPLAQTAGLSFPHLSEVRYAPCWTVMLGFERPLELPPYRLGGAPITWMARECSKPERPPGGESLVVQAGPDWSRRHLELPSADIVNLLRSELTAAPVLSLAHRWRYALVEQAAGLPCLWDKSLRIGACGDWCLGPGLEAAFLSGEAMAERVLRDS